MSALTQPAEQIREAIAAMPMQSRVIAGMLVVAIVLALGMLVRGGSADSTEYLLGSGTVFSEIELDAAEIAFGQAGLNGWKRDGRRVRVPSDDKGKFLEALAKSERLPPGIRSKSQATLDSLSVFEPRSQREARQDHAKEVDTGSLIARFPDIRLAEVDYDVSDKVRFGQEPIQTATVVVTPEGTEPLSQGRVAMVRQLVKGAYAGLKVDDIQVIDTNGSSMYSASTDDDPMVRKQREAEMRIETKIRSMLSDFGPIRVAVTAEIDPSMGAESAALTFGPQTQTLSEKSSKSEFESNRIPPSGVPGTPTNTTIASNRPTSLDGSSLITKTKEDMKESEKATPWTYQVGSTAGLGIKSASAAIMLPQSFIERLAKKELFEKYPETTEANFPLPSDDTADGRNSDYQTNLSNIKTETIDKIKDAVARILPGVNPGEERQKPITVRFYDDLPDDRVVESQAVQHALTWLSGSWQTIALICLAVVALMVARGAAKAVSSDGTPRDFSEGFGLELPAPPSAKQAEDEQAGVGVGADAMEITGGSLQEELVALVDSNPEVAANVLRGWVGDAA